MGGIDNLHFNPLKLNAERKTQHCLHQFQCEHKKKKKKQMLKNKINKKYV